MEKYQLALLLLYFAGIQSVRAEKVLYEVFNTKFTGVHNLSYGFSQARGLLKDEKQAILDMTNALRHKLATGKCDSSPAGLMPNATHMNTVEWDDALATFAQDWADRCTMKHSPSNISQSNYTSGAKICENLSGGTVLIEITMFGEVRNWLYIQQQCMPGEKCGHYNNLVSWSQLRIGCGYSACKTGPASVQEHLVCEFAPFRAAGKPANKDGRLKFQREYWTNLKPGVTKSPDAFLPSEPCSECIQGYDYCMNGGLCATKEQCESDPINNKCVCKNDKKTCESNGGTFDVANCRCKCPSNKMGRNCAQKCQNQPGAIFCGMTCGGSQLEIFHCHEACGSCGSDVSAVYKYWQVDRKTRNKDNLKVRAIAPQPVPPIPKDVVTAKLSNRGKCKNKNGDYFCENIFRRNYCNGTLNGAMWKHYCAASCNSCNDKEWENLVAAAVKRAGGTSGATKWTSVDSSYDLSGSDWVPQGSWSESSSPSGGGSGGWTPAGSNAGSGGWSPVGSSYEFEK